MGTNAFLNKKTRTTKILPVNVCAEIITPAQSLTAVIQPTSAAFCFDATKPSELRS